MNSNFEGDLIRPLGLVTLYFGYVEAEVNTLIDMLRDCGLTFEVSPVAPLGYRLSVFAKGLGEFCCAEGAEGAEEVLELLEESKLLIDRRNALVHASILAKGLVLPNDSSRLEFSITPEELTALADEAFTWKERLNAAVQLRLLPTLRERIVDNNASNAV